MVWAEIAQGRFQGQFDLLTGLLMLAQIAEDGREVGMVHGYVGVVGAEIAQVRLQGEIDLLTG
jgi:hypothetical protein